MNEITMPWPPRELSPNSRVHWAKKASVAKSYRSACWILARQAGVKFQGEGKVPVRVVFWPPNRQRRDLDNCIASVKAMLDGLADALRIDDSRFVPTFELSDVVGGCVKVRVG